MKCINAINIGISQTAIPDISVFVFLHNELILDFFKMLLLKAVNSTAVQRCQHSSCGRIDH